MKNNKGIFKKPYLYKEAFVLTAFILLLGFCVEIITGSKGVVIPSLPQNIHILLGIIVIIIFTRIILFRSYFFKWITSVPVSVSAITGMGILVLFMALIPQTESTSSFVNLFGLNHMSSNWAMISIGFFLLYNLGLVILRRVRKLTVKNAIFLLNHLGLWIIIAAGTLGSGDLVRLKMYVLENETPEWRAIDKNDKVYELPIAVKLIDFHIEEFNPEIALIDNNTGKVVFDDDSKVQMIEENREYFLKDFKIVIEKYYKSAMRVEGNYVQFHGEGSAPAILISVYNKSNIKIGTEWVSSASNMMSPQLMTITDEYSIGLLQPTPKEYSSDVVLFSADGTKTNAKIEVNKPFRFKGWKIYQVSYDEKRGKWSELSVLELVRDPWIGVVYIGIFMVLIGSVCLFWIGKKETK